MSAKRQRVRGGGSGTAITASVAPVAAHNAGPRAIHAENFADDRSQDVLRLAAAAAASALVSTTEPEAQAQASAAMALARSARTPQWLRRRAGAHRRYDLPSSVRLATLADGHPRAQRQPHQQQQKEGKGRHGRCTAHLRRTAALCAPCGDDSGDGDEDGDMVEHSKGEG